MEIKPTAPKSHPRFLSLYYRDLLSIGVKQGITSLQGLTAHGRGEAFDYLLGEKTHSFSHSAIKCAAACFLTAKYPVISVNGNTAILVPRELIRLAKVTGARLEVNLFHKSKIREKKIVSYLKKFGADDVLLPDKARIIGLESNRAVVSSQGQKIADVIFVPLEDGDRTERLIQMGKKVIAVDLNPLSRTAQAATVTIVDNIVRVIPLIIQEVISLKEKKKRDLLATIKSYSNKAVLAYALGTIKSSLTVLVGSSRDEV